MEAISKEEKGRRYLAVSIPSFKTESLFSLKVFTLQFMLLFSSTSKKCM